MVPDNGMQKGKLGQSIVVFAWSYSQLSIVTNLLQKRKSLQSYVLLRKQNSTAVDAAVSILNIKLVSSGKGVVLQIAIL